MLEKSLLSYCLTSLAVNQKRTGGRAQISLNWQFVSLTSPKSSDIARTFPKIQLFRFVESGLAGARETSLSEDYVDVLGLLRGHPEVS